MKDDSTSAVVGVWTRLSTTVLFESEWLEVRRDETVLPDGSRGTYDHVVIPGSVTVLAVDDDGLAAVTRQWIYLHGATQWRLPTGRMDIGDTDLEAAARRELREETGILADRLRPLGSINCGDSFSNHREHAFLATGLRAGSAELEPGEADLEVRWLPFAEVLELVTGGDMPHAGSSFAVLNAYVLGAVG